MNLIKLIIIFFMLYTHVELNSAARQDTLVKYMQPGDSHLCCASNIDRVELMIFCYEGLPVHLLRMFQSVYMELKIDSEKYYLYDGHTENEVKKQYVTNQYSWYLSTLWGSPKKREMQLNPFNSTCIGLSTKEDYLFKLIVLRISYYRLIVFAIGVFLFFSSPKLSRNVSFHYISGISIGVLASILILLFFVSKMIPKKSVVAAFMVTGWMVTAYLLNMAWENTRSILTEYKTHLACYIALSSLLSFVVCYRLGPVTNQRTLNLLQWFMQAVGLLLILFCSHYQEASVGFIILLITIYNFPQFLITRFSVFWHRCFPPKPILLTMEEFELQGSVETEKALKELREYCSTPQSNPWKLQLKLSDPVRFAKFMQGESHLSDNELMEYDVDTANNIELISDDDDENY